MVDSLATSDHMILTGLNLATKRPTVAAFSSTAFVMDTSFQRPNYGDNVKAECKAQHEKGRLKPVQHHQGCRSWVGTGDVPTPFLVNSE